MDLKSESLNHAESRCKQMQDTLKKFEEIASQAEDKL
jgi:hypothetical protein